MLKIDWATYKAALYACKNWHYSKTIPRCGLVKVGAWEDGRFIGVIIFSLGATSKLVKPYGLEMREGCELTRIAMRDHKTPISRMMSLALKYLKKTNPGLKMVVSFADPSQGHHGGIYQATNWIYTGKTPDSYSYKDKHGKIWHARNIGTDTRKKAIMRLRTDCTKILNPGKHRYLMPLNKEMAKQIEHLKQPYPKRTKKQASEHPSELGGSIPTCALQ